ncbi:myosin heavy chain, putative [Eimeria praecox]|uniref:Myosin heavy chain, putative n=1 Tax=Eimeria praecox TaxID=51316 RepID=U6G1P5_9EIME|nr:myosin heavy chain, putative [Eimeria praecox]
MDAENFSKLTAILDLLDRHKKNLAQAVQLDNPDQTPRVLGSGSALSKRSTQSEGLFGFGNASDGQQPMDAVAHAEERRKTVNRAQTLLFRRRTRLRKSFPSLSEPTSKSVSISRLDEELKDCIVSRGMMRMFDSRQDSNKRSSEASDCGAQSDCLDYMPEKSFGPPDVDWEDSRWQPMAASDTFDNMTSSDYVNLRPQILGQLFDKILDCLQNDFDELVGKLKEQVQELKEMTDRISYLETEGRELTKQLSTLETRIKAYQDSQKNLVNLEEEKDALSRECASLQESIKKLTLQVSEQDSQKLPDWTQDLAALKEKEDEIKVLKRELSKRERQLESLNATLTAPFPAALDSLRGAETASRQATPRGSFGHLLSAASSPRRTSVKHLLVTPQFPSPEPGLSLATELQLTKQPSVSRRLVEVQEKLGTSLAELETLRESNESLKTELEKIRKEMENKEATADQKLQENSRELAAAQEQLVEKTAALQRTAEALATTEGDLNASTAALYLTAADNEYLQANNERLKAQVAEAKQMLREAQERHADALASRAPPAVVKDLEGKVAQLVSELQTRASLLDQAEKRQTELEGQLQQMHRSVETNMQQIEKLSSQVKRLEGKLAATNNAASALGEASNKLIELVKRGDGSGVESEEAERGRKELLNLLEQERRRVEALSESIQQQQSIEMEQQEFQETAEALQQQLREQVAYLQHRLQQQEKEAEAVRQDLYRQIEMTDKAKEEVRTELRAACDRLEDLQEQLQETMKQKLELEVAASEWEAQRTEMRRQREETQEALEAQERELQQVQERVQELLQRIDEYASKEAACIAEGEALRGNIAQLELSVQAAKKETERQLAEKEQDRLQLERAQQTAMAVLQQQIEQLKEERAHALQSVNQEATATLGQEYKALKETVNSLREQNAGLLVQLQLQQHTSSAEEQQQKQWQSKYEALLASLGDAQERYRNLDLMLQRSYTESHRSLQEAQQQLQQLLVKDNQSHEPHFKESPQQLERDGMQLHVVVSEVRDRHAEAPQPVMEEWKQEREASGGDEEIRQQLETGEAHALPLAQDTQKPFQQLLASLEEQRQQFEDAAAKQKLLIAANEQMCKENLHLKAELEELKSVILTERREGGVASVLELVQRQLQQLAAAFDAFKRAEEQQIAGLKGSVGGPTHVFNVSYPPFVIPMVNVHESKDGSDKTINISGVLDVRAASAGVVSAGGIDGLLGPRVRLPALQGSRFREWFSRWGKDEVQALRLCVGPTGSAPRLEGPFQLSEMLDLPAKETSRNNSSGNTKLAPATAY